MAKSEARWAKRYRLAACAPFSRREVSALARISVASFPAASRYAADCGSVRPICIVSASQQVGPPLFVEKGLKIPSCCQPMMGGTLGNNV
jgi:hypothetical protein